MVKVRDEIMLETTQQHRLASVSDRSGSGYAYSPYFADSCGHHRQHGIVGEACPGWEQIEAGRLDQPHLADSAKDVACDGTEHRAPFPMSWPCGIATAAPE